MPANRPGPPPAAPRPPPSEGLRIGLLAIAFALVGAGVVISSPVGDAVVSRRLGVAYTLLLFGNVGSVLASIGLLVRNGPLAIAGAATFLGGCILLPFDAWFLVPLAFALLVGAAAWHVRQPKPTRAVAGAPAHAGGWVDAGPR